MPRITPLSAVRSTLVARGWTHLDALHAMAAPEATAWVDGAGLVASWEQAGTTIVHAIEAEAFGPTTQLLAGLLPALPHRLELRVGSAAAGVLSETHHIEMVGPVRRMLWRRSAVAPPPGLRPLTPADMRRVTALHDRDAPPLPEPLPEGWTGLFRDDGELLAVGGLLSSAQGIHAIAPLRVRRGARKDPALPGMLAAIARTVPSGDAVVLDVRMDRRGRSEIAEKAGFYQVGGFERWSAKRA